MEDPLLNNPTYPHTPRQRLIHVFWKSAPPLCFFIFSVVCFGIVAHTFSTIKSVHSNQIQLFDEHKTILNNIALLINDTHSDIDLTQTLYERFENMYTVAKIMCQLSPEYEEYCKLLQ